MLNALLDRFGLEPPDRPTLLLLRHLAHETAHDSLLIVGTYRSTDLDRILRKAP